MLNDDLIEGRNRNKFCHQLNLYIMAQGPKVIGKITLPDAPIKHKCVCEECNSVVDDRFGDPRVKISTFNSKDAKEPSAVRWVCECCADELFSDSSPHSIFG